MNLREFESGLSEINSRVYEQERAVENAKNGLKLVDYEGELKMYKGCKNEYIFANGFMNATVVTEGVRNEVMKLLKGVFEKELKEAENKIEELNNEKKMFINSNKVDY